VADCYRNGIAHSCTGERLARPLEIFSRYTKVETAEGQEVTLPEYLEKIWEVVGRVALEQVLGSGEAQVRNGAAGALEEDARLTALFLWTVQSTNGQGNGSAVANEADDLDEDEEEEAPKSKPKGFSLVFDVVRRFAQPLGIHLPAWEDRIIETKKGVVRLMAVTERAQQLFGDAGSQAIADQLEHNTAGAAQLTLFPDSSTGVMPRVRGRGRRRSGPVDVADESLSTQRGATTLDRVHAAMLLQSSGRTNALRALLTAEQERGPDFLRLANALSALYPRGSEEKRLLDAMLLAVPR
jgi:putative DNA methylase